MNKDNVPSVFLLKFFTAIQRERESDITIYALLR